MQYAAATVLRGERMTATEFRVWQARTGIKNGDLAEQLGKSRDTISVWRSQGVGDRDSKTVRLALAAIEKGLAPA